MKVVILGDPHFGGGYSLGRVSKYKNFNSRLIDYSKTFDYVIDYLIINNVSNFIITGDIFQHRRPQAYELGLFSEKIHRLEELGIETHIVIGNHDLVKDQKATTMDVLQKLRLPRTHIYYDIETFQCKDKNGGLNFIFLPFRNRSILNCETNDNAIRMLESMLQYEIDNIKNNYPKILIGHFILKDTMLGNNVLKGEGDEVILPIEMFKEMDATVIGHVHPHQVVQKKPLVTYIGSMECKDFGESNLSKYLLLIDSSNGLKHKFKELPTRKLYDISIDQSDVFNKHEIFDNIKNYLLKTSNINKMEGSIIRLTVLLNEDNIKIDSDKIVLFMKKDLKVHNCVGIYSQVVSKKQLRKSTITEKSDPLVSFNEYLEHILVDEDSQIKDEMRVIGTKIISDRGKL